MESDRIRIRIVEMMEYFVIASPAGGNTTKEDVDLDLFMEKALLSVFSSAELCFSVLRATVDALETERLLLNITPNVSPSSDDSRGGLASRRSFGNSMVVPCLVSEIR
ncbi:hypothetical protein V6N13_136946 [Hibiscus sabdariffa]